MKGNDVEDAEKDKEGDEKELKKMKGAEGGNVETAGS